MATTLLSTTIRTRTKAALDALSYADVEKLSTNRDLLLDVLNEIGHERVTKMAYVRELAEIQAQLGREKEALALAEKALATVQKERSADHWDHGRRNSKQ
jgi:hypothetical protein